MVNQEINITKRQMSRLIITLILATGILYLPAITLQQSGNGGWLSPLISVIPGLIIIVVICSLQRAYPGKTLIEYSSEIFGSLGGKVVGVLYSFYFWHVGLLVIRELIGLVHAVVLPQTPILMVNIIIFATMAYVLYCGIEGIARVNEMIYALLFTIFIAFILSSLASIHPDSFLPILNQGFQGVLRGAFVPMSWFGEVVLVGMLLPFLTKQNQLRVSLVRGLTISAMMLALTTGMVMSVLGTSEAARLQFPTFDVVRYIQWGDFFQHLDILFLFPWLFIMMIKSLLFCFSGIQSISQTFNLSDHRFVIVPYLALSMVANLWLFPDEIELKDFLAYAYPSYILAFELLLPILLLVTYFIRNRRHIGSYSS